MSDNPLPLSLLLLWLALPGIWLAGYVLTSRIARNRADAVLLAPGLGAAIWLVCVHAAGRASRSFVTGLSVGTIAPAAVAICAWLLLRRRPALLPRGERSSKWMWFSAAASTALIAAPLALSGAWHDELSPAGHMATIAQMQNGVYPPRFLPFVEHELRYHYGFNALTAAATALFRLRIDAAIDAVTCAGWFYSWCLLVRLGDRLLGGRRRGLLTAALALLGGGAAPFVVWLWDGPLTMTLASNVKLDGDYLNPPLTSYFFQHPWSVGIPFGLCFILLFMGPPRRRPVTQHVALGVLLLALALSQFVLFLALLGASLGATIMRRGHGRLRRTGQLFLTGAVVVLCASQLGGFFAPAYRASAGGLRSSILLGSGVSVTWQLVSFGFLLPLGAAGLFFLRRERALFGFLAAGGILAQTAFRYAYTNDMAKFGNLAAFALGVAASAAVARLIELRSPWLRRTLPALAVGLATAGGVLFAAILITRVDPRNFSANYAQAGDLSGDDARALAFLRRRVKRDELVYRTSPSVALRYVNWGGIAGPSATKQVLQHGFTTADFNLFRRALGELPEDVDAYIALRIRWLVLAPSDRRLLERAARWQSQGRAETAATFGSLRVIRLLPRPLDG